MQFFNEFIYKKTKLDGWRIIDKSLEGTCEDFALTTLYILEDKNWFKVFWAVCTFKAIFWLVHSPSNKLIPRHTILYYRGKGWVGSTYREWRPSPAPHKLRLPLLLPWVLFRSAWGVIYSFISSIL